MPGRAGPPATPSPPTAHQDSTERPLSPAWHPSLVTCWQLPGPSSRGHAPSGAGVSLHLSQVGEGMREYRGEGEVLINEPPVLATTPNTHEYLRREKEGP